MTVREAIDVLNSTRFQVSNFRTYLRFISHAAKFDNDVDAQNFMYLCNWKHEQLPN